MSRREVKPRLVIAKKGIDTKSNVREIILSDRTSYYIDSVPEKILKQHAGESGQDHLIDNKVNILYLKNFKDAEPTALDIAATEMEDIKQPTENAVRRAMILKIGFDGFWYVLKAGGGSMSDSAYSSMIQMDVEGRNGEDVMRTILVKFSNKFEDILITPKEIRDIKSKIIKLNDSKKIRKDEVEGLMDFIVVSQLRGKVRTDKGDEPYSKEFEDRIMSKILELGDDKIYREHINFRIKQSQSTLDWIGDKKCIYMIGEGLLDEAECEKRTADEIDRLNKTKAQWQNLYNKLFNTDKGLIAAADGLSIKKNKETWQIRNSEGKYYSRSMSGNTQWFEGEDMGYMFTKDEADRLKVYLEAQGYSNLTLVDKDSLGKTAYIDMRRNKFVLIDPVTNNLWANEYFTTEDEVKEFTKQNNITLLPAPDNSSVNNKMQDGGDIIDEGDTKDAKVISPESEDIANEIISQLGGYGKLRAMLGAYNFAIIGNGVSFRIKNAKANYINIVLNSMDTYDVKIWRIRGSGFTVVSERDNVYNDELKEFIENTTGMYISLEDGGPVVKKQYDVDVLYRDGANFKSFHKFTVDEETVTSLRIGDTVPSEAFGISRQDWFENYLDNAADPDFDHNLLEIELISPKKN